MRRRSSVKERPTPVTADEITSPGRRGSAIKFAKSAIVPPTEEALDIEECEAGPSVADPRTMNNRRVSIKQQINLFHHRRSSFDATAMEQAAAAQAAAEAEASVPTGTAAPASDLVAQEEDVELLASPRTAEALVAEALAEAETTAGGATGVDGYGFGDREPDFVLDGFAFFDFGADIGATFDVGGSLSSNDATARDERAKRWAADSESFERPARQSRLGSGRISRYVENGVAPVDSFSNVEISVELTSALRNKTISEPAALDHDVGTYTCGGMQGGAQKTNQDCACHAQPFAGAPGTALFIVCDGHGRDGHGVSQEVLNSLIYELEDQDDMMEQEPGTTLANAFISCNDHLQSMCNHEEIDTFNSGACAVLAYMQRSSLWVASTGDCRAILGTQMQSGELQTHPLSVDHNVDHPMERVRLEMHGATVREAQVDEDGEMMPGKLYSTPECDMGPGLSVSRALGDLSASDLGVIPHPQIVYHKATADDRYLVLATDGVWTFLESVDVMGTVHKTYKSGGRALDACKLIIARAARAWQQHEGTNYRDDITVIVVYVQELLAHLLSEASDSPRALDLIGKETASMTTS